MCAGVFNPLMLNPFKLPNLLHANNDYLVLLSLEPLLLFQTSNSLYTHGSHPLSFNLILWVEKKKKKVSSGLTELRFD